MRAKPMLRNGSWIFIGCLAAAVACGGDTPPGEGVGSSSQAVVGQGGALGAGAVPESATAMTALDQTRTVCSALPSPVIDAGPPIAAPDAGIAVASADAGPDQTTRSPIAPSVVDHFEFRGPTLAPHWKTAAPAGAKHLGEVTLPARSAGAFQLTDVDTSMQIRVSLVGAHDVPAEVGHGHVVYRGAEASGADVIHRLTQEGTEDFISFKIAPARASSVVL